MTEPAVVITKVTRRFSPLLSQLIKLMKGHLDDVR